MGVFGKTYKSAFSGLGKPSIKLEFEDNESLVAFSKRMQEGKASPVTRNEEEEMFVPVEGYGDFYTVRDMRKRSRKEPGDVATNKNLQFIKDATKTIKNFNHKFYLAAQAQQDKLGLFPNELEFDGKLYEKIKIYDSKDGWYFNINIFLPYKKNQNNIFKGYTENYAVYFDIDKCINIAPTDSGGTLAYITKDYYTELYSSAILAYYNILIKRRAFYIEKKYDTSEIDKQIKYYVLYYSDPAKYQALHTTGYAIGSAAYEAKKYAKSGLFDGVVGLGAPGDTYIITDTRTRARKDLEDTAALKKYDIRKFSGEELQKMQEEDPLLYEQIKSDITTSPASITPPAAQKIPLAYEVDNMLEKLKEQFKPYQGLDESKAKAVSRAVRQIRAEIIKYLIEEVQKGNFDYVKKVANILGYEYVYDTRVADTHSLIEQFATITPSIPEGWRVSTNPPNYLPKLPKGFVYVDNGASGLSYRHKMMPVASGLGRAAANDALYNNNDILDCRGLKPTYKILQSYDAFFAPAQHSQTFAGVGLDDTKKLIADICKAHYKDCARIAQHLKADTKLQSVFNLWHWLRHNIRYEYDREGREEVRTPLRTWADRQRGVDCDCLSVFAWCVLKCMGYDPAFELVCFKGKKQPSHILVNLDGIRCDRVWFVFNSLPPGVTNSEIYRLTDRATAAQLAGLFN